MTPHLPETAAFLDPPETSVPCLPDHAWLPMPEPPVRFQAPLTRTILPAVAFRHSGWARDRQRVYNALERTLQSASRLDAFAHCGSRSYVYQTLDDPPEYRVAGSACHDRFCMPCTRERGQTVAANINTRLEQQRARFVTLTLRTDGLDCAGGMLKLQHAFRRLLRTRLWLDRVDGGAAFLEVKWNADSSRWHPHIHAIVQGRFIPHDQLARAWKRITGDSHIVRIQLVASPAEVVRYVTTYASKCLRTADFPTDAVLQEAINVLHRTRLCRTFGTWRGLRLAEPDPSTTWVVVAPLADLLRRAVTGDLHARGILAKLKSLDATRWLHDHPARPPPLPAAAGSRADPQILLAFSPLAIQ